MQRMMPDYYDTNVCESGCNTPQMQLYQQKLSGVRFNVTLITLQVILEIFLPSQSLDWCKM